METISIGESLVITVFSMAVVFLVLIGISFLIDLLRIMVEKLEDRKMPGKNPAKQAEPGKKIVDPVEKDMEDEELIAVISAAVAASMGLDLPDINIKSIRRLDNTWRDVARNEQVLK